MPLPEGPGIAVDVDYIRPLPVTPRGNTYILLFGDRFSDRADLFAVTSAEFTAKGTANILINWYIPLWILSNDGLQCCSSCRRSSTSLLEFGKLPPAPISQKAMVG